MQATALVHGFPAKSASHGSLGWCSVWLLESGDRRVLVETGPPGYAPRLLGLLAERDLAPRDITDVLITHAHWDHLYNLPMFPHATWWIGRDELTWARDLPAETPFVSPLHVAMLDGGHPHVGLVDDGDVVLPGVRVVATPGHTPGHLAYVVEAERALIFAGDSVKNIYELSTGLVDMTLDQAASEASVRLLRDLMRQRGAVLVPGHDVPLEVDERGEVRRTTLQQASLAVYLAPDEPPTSQPIGMEGSR